MMLNTAARMFFYLLEALNRMNGGGSASLRRVASFARRWRHRTHAGAHVAAPGGQEESAGAGFGADVRRAGTCVRDARGRYVVAPAVEGRIRVVGGGEGGEGGGGSAEAQQQQQQEEGKGAAGG